jgi:formylglycine-generating enzyme required for sulfatase activity
MPFIARSLSGLATSLLALHAAAQAAPAEQRIAMVVPSAIESEQAEAARVAKAIVMVPIRGRSFLMGNDRGFADEKPVHKVKLRSFRMGKYEVTFEQYDPFCRQRLPSCPDDGGWGRGNLPVVNVSWDDASAFAEWLNAHTGRRFRLPTEAEWEYAARARTVTAYLWGNEMQPGRANCDSGCADPFAHTAPVGSFRPNAYGLYDMQGNVWEWTQDCYNGNYIGAPVDGSAWAAGSCAVRVVRGGSWASSYAALRSADRDWDRTDYHSGTRSRGFRLAEDLPLSR